MANTLLRKVTGKWVRESVDWLDAKGCGCCSICYATTAKYRYCVCIGWHDYGDRWNIAWKIGRQTRNNAMQCDLDVDFEMPWPCNRQGDVYDTLREILGPVGPRRIFWDRMAAEMRKDARKVFAFFKDKDDWTEENFK